MNDAIIYKTTIRCRWLGDGATTFDEYIGMIEERVNYLKELRDTGVVLADEVEDDYATLTTTDPKVAERFGLEVDNEEEDLDHHDNELCNVDPEGEAKAKAENQARWKANAPPEGITVDDYWGGCRVCGKNDGYLNVGPNHVFFCEEHKMKWCVGSNLFSDWRNEDEAQWRKNWEKLEAFTEIEPHPCTDPACYAPGFGPNKDNPRASDNHSNLDLAAARWASVEIGITS